MNKIYMLLSMVQANQENRFFVLSIFPFVFETRPSISFPELSSCLIILFASFGQLVAKNLAGSVLFEVSVGQGLRVKTHRSFPRHKRPRNLETAPRTRTRMGKDELR